MDWSPSRRELIATGGAAMLVAAAARHGLAQAIPASPEPGDIKMGIEPWLGYGQWHIAGKKGLFKQAGLDSVEIVNFTTDADINAALAAGQLQCGNIATQTAMNFIAAGLPLKIVALLDVSKTADAMISDGSVTVVKDLKGKQVAYEEGTTSDILLNYALGQNGMTVADIQKVPMPAADAGAALIAGKVPVAVTYEPYLTLAMQQNPKEEMIYTAGENPGLISDVFVVREEFLKDKPEELGTAFDGVVYYSIAENKSELNGSFAKKVIPEVHAAARKANILQKDVDLTQAIDGRFVDAATS